MEKPLFKFAMGVKVRDVLTGFEGRIISRVDHFTGCAYYGVQPEGLDDKGGIKEQKSLDENRLTVIDAKPIELNQGPTDPPGGPRDIPPQPR